MDAQKPYSDNVIFMDTEFTALDAVNGQLLSIGLVKMSGEELYLELEYDDVHIDPWVIKNVLPFLTGNTVSIDVAREKILAFLGKTDDENQKPYLVAYVNQFDAIFWYKLFGSPKDHPAYWIPIDFASILFAHGFSPNSMGKHTFFNDLGLIKDDTASHQALEDAKLLRETYIRFFERLQIAA